MALTKLDSTFFRGKKTVLDTSSYTSFNAGLKPGRLVLAGSVAVKSSLGSQIAARLSLEHFTEAILDSYEEDQADRSRLLEQSLRCANEAVYNFGHKLAAGGRLAAAIIALVIEAGDVSAARVGALSAYLYRNGTIFPFFLAKESADTCIGTNSRVTVETAEVKGANGDIVFVFSETLTLHQEEKLSKLLLNKPMPKLETVVAEIFEDIESLEFAQMTCIGPETVYLANRIK
ncbi:MAG: hypothetical protein ACOX2O_04040 [Bdellovibrionota bacterium]|jgi:hypothetical protein